MTLQAQLPVCTVTVNYLQTEGTIKSGGDTEPAGEHSLRGLAKDPNSMGQLTQCQSEGV